VPPSSPAPVSDPPQPERTLSLKPIQENWDATLDGLASTLGPGTVGLLHRALPAGLNGSVLTIQFESVAKVQKEMCESNGRKEQIQQALSSALGASIELEFCVADPDANAPAADHQTLKRKRQDLLNDPAVKTVLMGLNATVTNIEEQ
jgi:hypothetical protein